MAAKTGKLAGQTIFITGASRGIGHSIALKCARDGANIVIAAKTTAPHPKLPGTIYTAAKDMEEAGGKSLACVVDIRDEKQVESAVKEAANKFGGIDILINNASAIHLTGTEATPMKRFDLMMAINARGTFLSSKYCIPYLKKSQNPHILNISPPLNMSPGWFKNHVGYTMAKYGMSMCALGMAEEYKNDGIAVNCLWPRTGIYTAAMAMLAGGEAIKPQCRKPEIMADAAYSILTKDSRSATGQFYIDDEVLKESGVTDIEQYAYQPGATLLPDFFLDVPSEKLVEMMEAEGAKPRFRADGVDTSASEGSSSGPEATFQSMQHLLNEDIVKMINGVFAFDLKDAGVWYLDVKNGPGSAGRGEPPHGSADVTMTTTSDVFVDMFSGKIAPTQAFMGGKLKIKGDLGLAMKLEKLMKQMKSKL